MNTSVTPVQTPDHFSDCDSRAIGRRMKRLSQVTPDEAYTPRFLMKNLDGFRGSCDCFRLQLTRVEADLSARRKAQRAGHDCETEIAALIVARDALRAVTA